MNEERSHYYDRGYVDYHKLICNEDDAPYAENTFASEEWRKGFLDADTEFNKDMDELLNENSL